MNNLESRIAALEERNKRVEGDKAWETSKTRRFILLVLTFLIIGSYMSAIGVSNPWINAVIPSVGFILSTLSLSYLKKYWEKFIRREN